MIPLTSVVLITSFGSLLFVNINRLNFSVNKNCIKNINVFHTAIGNTCGTVELGATEEYSPN